MLKRLYKWRFLPVPFGQIIIRKRDDLVDVAVQLGECYRRLLDTLTFDGIEPKIGNKKQLFFIC